MKKMIMILVLSTITLFSLGKEKMEELFGVASYYASKFEGRRTANGEIFRKDSLTAASNRFKFNTLLKVTNMKNGKSVIVRVNDRMGNKTRLVDLSPAAAKELGFFKHGLTRVKIETVDEDFVDQQNAEM